jgi:beta-N-acetylhexosaminidase
VSTASERKAGRTLVVGFEGTALPSSLAEALAEGALAGVIVFRRNLPDRESTAALVASVHAAARESGALPPLVGDRRRGRPRDAPALTLHELCRRCVGSARSATPSSCDAPAGPSAAELAGLGINLDFAPDPRRRLQPPEPHHRRSRLLERPDRGRAPRARLRARARRRRRARLRQSTSPGMATRTSTVTSRCPRSATIALASTPSSSCPSNARRALGSSRS